MESDSSNDSQMSTDDLQFTNVEPGVASPSASAPKVQLCVACRRPIESTYYAVNDKMICESCRAQIGAPPAGSQFARLLKATVLGLGAGLLGALIWYAIRKVAHIEIGLVAIAVGYMVGKAVRKGSGGLGGRGYQILAVVLTYCCIAANYMPDLVVDLFDKAHTTHSTVAGKSKTASHVSSDATATTADDDAIAPGTVTSPKPKIGLGKAIGALVVVVIVVFVMSLALPFAAGAQNLIGLLIIGFALWEAWKLNARRRLPITGPYQLARSPQHSIGGADFVDQSPTVSS